MECLAHWREGSTNYMVARLHSDRKTNDEESYRCFIYTNPSNNTWNLAQSSDAACNGLISVTEAARTFKMTQSESLRYLALDLFESRAKNPDEILRRKRVQYSTRFRALRKLSDRVDATRRKIQFNSHLNIAHSRMMSMISTWRLNDWKFSLRRRENFTVYSHRLKASSKTKYLVYVHVYINV